MLADLVLWLGSVYGLAWLGTKSALLAKVRVWLPFERYCLVCFGTWVGFALIPLIPRSGLFSDAFRVTGFVDWLFLSGFTLAGLWIVGHLAGDAD